MATANFFAPGFDDQMEQQNIERQRQYAQALRKQSQEPMAQGQMVGKHFVAPSFTQGLAKMLQSYYAGQGESQADEQQKALAEAVRGRNAQEMTDFMAAAKGEPGRDIQPLTPNDDEGNPMPVAHKEATGPDLARALQIGMNSHIPGLQQAAGTMFNQQFVPKTAKWEKFDKPDGQGGHSAGFVDVNSSNPMSTFQAGGNQPAKPEQVNGQFVNPFTTPAGTIIPKQANAPDLGKDLVIPGTNGAMVPNVPLIDARKAIGKAGASNVQNTVSVAGPENKYNQDVGAGLAKDGLALIEQAKAAPSTIENARMIRRALDSGAITGTGADARLAVTKALETAGVLGEGKAASTQELMAGLSKLTLSGIRTSGLGGGNGFTNSDREFLNAAIGGSIDSTPANLRRVADLSERAATATYAKGAKVLNRWKANPALGAVSQDTELDAIPAPAAPVAAPANRPPLKSFNK